MKAISLDATIIITEISKRTLWRRLTDGQITRLNSDDRGRAMLSFDEIAPLICVPIEQADYELFIDADAGDADAQNDLALLFIEANKLEPALYWLQAAADQQHPDAMHNLAQLYIKGVGIPKDENIGLMWLAKAAAHGHGIAEKQISGLISNRVKCGHRNAAASTKQGYRPTNHFL